MHLRSAKPILSLASRLSIYAAILGAATKASDFSVAWRVAFGSDADNVRVDPLTRELFVGYSSALASLDDDGRNIRKSQLGGHPEAFQIAGESVFINVPSARQIAVLDRKSGQVKTWPMQTRANFPMAIPADAKQVISLFEIHHASACSMGEVGAKRCPPEPAATRTTS